VSEILRGRQVRDVEVLERIADGLNVPRVYLCLLDDAKDAYPGKITGSPEEVEEMPTTANLNERKALDCVSTPPHATQIDMQVRVGQARRQHTIRI
jgi:hypothetical protein